MYCGNDPVNRVDPSGCFWNVVIGAVVGTVTGAIVAAMSGENIWAGAASGLIAGTICGLTLGIGSAIALAGGAANTLIGLTLAAAGGFAGSFIGESARQLGNYGCINDWGKAFDEGISGAVANTVAFGVGNWLSSGFPKKEAVKNVKGEIAVFKTMAKTFITQSAAETMANFYFSMFLVAPLQYSISLTLEAIGGE